VQSWSAARMPICSLFLCALNALFLGHDNLLHAEDACQLHRVDLFGLWSSGMELSTF